MESLAKKIVIALVFMNCAIGSLSAQELSRPLPLNAAPGLVEIQSGPTGPVYASLELDGWRSFPILEALPLSQIKEDRAQAHINNLACYPAATRRTCVIDVTVDGTREVWFYRQQTGELDQTLMRLPERVADGQFLTFPRSSVSGEGLLSFVAYPHESRPAKLWLENTNRAGELYAYELSDPRQVAFVRPTFHGKSLAGLFLLLSPTNERLAHAARGVGVVAANSNGQFTEYGIPPNCEVLGAFKDRLICAERTRSLAFDGDKPIYPKIMKLRAPPGVHPDVSRSAGAPAIQGLRDAILFRGFVGGVARPYVQHTENEARMALRDPAHCIDPDEHVDVFDVTASREAVLLSVFSPISPARLILAPVDRGLIDVCGDEAQVFSRQLSTLDDHSEFTIDRTEFGDARRVPVTLVTGTNEGVMQGHMLLMTYAISGLWLQENYLGPWLSEWVEKGGRIAFVHLPGGGGFGAQWARQGFGIEGKISASALLDDVSGSLIDAGLAEEGKVSILTESGGGPLAANAILRSPRRYAALAVRAGCIALEAEDNMNCARSFEYGNWTNLFERNLIQEFEPLARIIQEEDYPCIVIGTPETDRVVDLEYQQRMLRMLSSKCTRNVEFTGVQHTQRSSSDQETRWVNEVAAAALNSVK